MLRFDVKDYLGIAIVAGAVGLLLVHEGEGHQEVHGDALLPTSVGNVIVADAEVAGNISVAATNVVSSVTVFSDFTVADREGRQFAEHQVVVVRDGRIEWIGPSDGATIPAGARVLHGDGTQFLVPADHATVLLGHGLQAGDPADVVVVSDDPVTTPEALENPLCVMRQGVVVSLSPSFAAAG